MNHFVMILYVLCCITGTATIIISRLLYRKFGYKAFKYLSILMTGSMISVLVEAVRTYSSIVIVDIETLKRVVYLVLEPSGEVLQFLMLPTIAFAAVGKKFPGRLSLICKIYALAVVATFPAEAITGSSAINIAREFAGHFVFHIFAYIFIFKNYSNITNKDLKKALKSYLVLSVVVIPAAIIFQSGLTASIINISYAEIPFPYIIYCLLFNILCITNTFKYLFIPIDQEERGIPNQFLLQHHITGREKEIIEQLLKGYSNQQIGKVLFISARTVKNHIYRIYRKTEVQNRMHLANRINLYHSIPEK